MTDTFRLLVSCTNRKRPAPKPDRRLSAIPPKSLPARFNLWVAARDSEGERSVRARDLYVGEHWRAVMGIRQNRIDVEGLWILSAGYGLLPEDATIQSYGATFTPGTPDSVCGRNDATTSRLWWNLLTSHASDRTMTPSIGDLALHNESQAIVVVASPTYLAATVEDLRAAGSILDDRLVIVSIGGRSFPGLSRHLLNVDARIEHLVGGSRTALNAKTAAAILNETRGESPTVSSLQRVVDSLVRDLPRHSVWNRKPHTDEELITWIRDRLASGHISRTRLLTTLRSEGHACEQRRFASLYERATA